MDSGLQESFSNSGTGEAMVLELVIEPSAGLRGSVRLRGGEPALFEGWLWLVWHIEQLRRPGSVPP